MPTHRQTEIGPRYAFQQRKKRSPDNKQEQRSSSSSVLHTSDTNTTETIRYYQIFIEIRTQAEKNLNVHNTLSE